MPAESILTILIVVIAGLLVLKIISKAFSTAIKLGLFAVALFFIRSYLVSSGII